ncbi:hypothetical protein ACFGVR_22270 [Mucilaginibacter sp. AW1-3]
MGLFHKINSCYSFLSDAVLLKVKKQNAGNSVFFHEDNYCQIELLPVQNLLTRQFDTDEVKRYAESNFTGDGFLNCSCRDEVAYPIKNLNIDKKEFKALIKTASLFYFDTVYTGYSSHRIPKKNTRGFGFENYVLYYEFQDDIITNCWLDYNPIADELNTYPERLQNILLQLGSAYGLILIDWNECLTVNLANKHALCDYMKEALD